VEDKVLKAFDELHKLGVMHGDIRAANILVETNGCVWIVDFELAKIVPDSGKTEMLKSEKAEVKRLLDGILSGNQYG
jgi:RIO-like serine/threonine protein kinase